MKLIKLTMLAAIAAIAAMAFIGASTASATPPWISICKKAELLNCANRVTHPLLGRIIPLAGKGFFQATIKVECTSGKGESNEIESQQEKEITGKLEKLNFTGCTGCPTVVVTPVAVKLNMAAENEGDWNLSANNAVVEFKGCLGGFVNCTFEGNLNLKVQMDATGAFADPEGAKFTLIKGPEACGLTGKWETGRTRFDWQLETTKVIHENVSPSLIGAKLIPTA
jgi:hypothetical protein